MADGIGKAEILRLLGELGQRVRGPATLVLVGSAPLILREQLDRSTTDIDVIESSPELQALREAIQVVERRAGAPAGWVNASVQSFREVLPPDYRRRVEVLGTFGRLRVEMVGRVDLIVMKLWGGTRRERDLEDLQMLAPTDAELDFASTQIERLGRMDVERAERFRVLIERHRRKSAE